MSTLIVVRLLCVLFLLNGLTVYAQSDTPTPLQLFDQFETTWDEALWTKNFRGVDGYMRPLTADDWQLRMTTIRTLVQQGATAVPHLVHELQAEAAPRRILAAQTLSFLAPLAPLEPLLQAANHDQNATVRLYAVDALGMRGGDTKIDWAAMQKTEQDRDVRKHIGYAIERASQGIASAVTADLLQWNPIQLDSARVGEPAPDFTLQAATGETVRLSDFRNQQAVVLVFIYGDT